MKGARAEMIKRGYKDGYVEYDDPKVAKDEAVKRDGTEIVHVKRGYQDGYVEYDDPKVAKDEAV